MIVRKVECAGTPRQLGRQTGEALREDIAANLELFRRPDPEAWQRRLPVMLETARRYLPDVLEEMQGLAEGADLAVEEIYRLNFPLWNDGLDLDGCTNLVFCDGPDGPVWGKNNDGCHPAPPRRVFVRHVRPAAAIPQVVFGFSGMVATTDGMNAEGVAVGHSSVGSVFQQSDRHPFIRLWDYAARSECATLPEYVRRMSEVPLHGKGYSIVCVDREGRVASLEAACPLMQVRRPDRPAGIQCVNCYRLPALSDADRRRPADKKDALSRAEYLDGVLAGDGPFDAEKMKRVLRNHDGQDICRHGSETCAHNTEYSMIALPAQNKVRYCAGHPCEGEFEQIVL